MFEKAKREDFNPRSPHGERHSHHRHTPTPYISIHAPRTGSDKELDGRVDTLEHFNPRSPHGERHLMLIP